MNYYGYSGKFVAQPGKRDELVEILLDAARALESNEDCIQYLVSIGDDPDAVWVKETWTSKEAHDASLEPEEVKEAIRRAMPLIKGIEDSVQSIIVGGKGI